MQQSSIDFLEANKHHYETLVRAQFVQHLDHATRQGLLDVIRQEFDPGYLSNLWCPDCVAVLLTFAYTQYNKWKEAQDKIKTS